MWGAISLSSYTIHLRQRTLKAQGYYEGKKLVPGPAESKTILGRRCKGCRQNLSPFVPADTSWLGEGTKLRKQGRPGRVSLAFQGTQIEHFLSMSPSTSHPHKLFKIPTGSLSQGKCEPGTKPSPCRLPPLYRNSLVPEKSAGGLGLPAGRQGVKFSE